MSRDNLRSKQTIILHNCIINDERCDLVITRHRQTIGYIRITRQTFRKKFITKQKQIFRKRFSKWRNAVSESETSKIQELNNFKDSKKPSNWQPIIFFWLRNHITIINKWGTKNKKVIHKQTNTFIQLESTNKTHWKLHANSNTTQKWFEMKKTTKKIPFSYFLINPLAETRGQVQFGQNLIANLFEKGDSPCTKEFRSKNQKTTPWPLSKRNLQPYTTIWNLYNRNQFTKCISWQIFNSNRWRRYWIFKSLHRIHKKYTTSNSQRANSKFINDVFSVIYSYLSILETTEFQGDSSIQTSRRTTIRHEIGIFSQFLNAIRENLTSNEITQQVKHDFQKILACFIIDVFSHNIDLISLARKN